MVENDGIEALAQQGPEGALENRRRTDPGGQGQRAGQGYPDRRPRRLVDLDPADRGTAWQPGLGRAFALGHEDDLHAGPGEGLDQAGRIDPVTRQEGKGHLTGDPETAPGPSRRQDGWLARPAGRDEWALEGGIGESEEVTHQAVAVQMKPALRGCGLAPGRTANETPLPADSGPGFHSGRSLHLRSVGAFDERLAGHVRPLRRTDL